MYSADRGFYSHHNIRQCKESGVELVCIPQRGGKKSPAQASYEKSSTFKDGQRFRAGIEGRISRGASPCCFAAVG